MNLQKCKTFNITELIGSFLPRRTTTNLISPFSHLFLAISLCLLYSVQLYAAEEEKSPRTGGRRDTGRHLRYVNVFGGELAVELPPVLSSLVTQGSLSLWVLLSGGGARRRRTDRRIPQQRVAKIHSEREREIEGEFERERERVNAQERAHGERYARGLCPHGARRCAAAGKRPAPAAGYTSAGEHNTA